MINLQMRGYAAALGNSDWMRPVQSAVLEKRCVCCDDYLHLSDDEVLADFRVLDPLEADAGGWLLEEIAQIQETLIHEAELVLIQWKDGIESLVVLPHGDVAPPSDILLAAYWNGYSTSYVRRHLDALWDTR